ncbi:MAG: helix-turn-helix domain-containing protein [Candidatus Symbiothrix sp.]|jgi:HTH-type transcriptional regulator/antitoxin HigA|nr:helix-turn-helix domain-containing protein [Candidatus Symbiothrix sp.]
MKKITNDKEYDVIKKRIDELLEIVSDENYEMIPESIELEFLSELIEEYEQKYYPVSVPTLAEILKLRMYEMNINQLQLAKILNVSPSRISEYLSGKEPTLKVAKVMCEYLNISANVLLGLNNKRTQVQFEMAEVD